jgi:hypothetical protein
MNTEVTLDSNDLHSCEEAAMTELPDHELEVLEDDQTVPPRPEELIADAARAPAPVRRSPADDGNPKAIISQGNHLTS